MTIMNKTKNHVEKLAKFNCLKNKTNKSCKPNQNKPHHTCCCGDAIAALQLFVYKTKIKTKKFVYKSAVEQNSQAYIGYTNLSL